jgi:hypothetical protein
MVEQNSDMCYREQVMYLTVIEAALAQREASRQAETGEQEQSKKPTSPISTGWLSGFTCRRTPLFCRCHDTLFSCVLGSTIKAEYGVSRR